MKNDLTASIGICLGASTVSMVEIQQTGSEVNIINTITQPHLGDIRGCLLEVLQQQQNLATKRLCITGRKLRHSLNLSSIAEPEAVELAVKFVLPEDHPYRVVISAGGETFMVYSLDEPGFIQDIQTGNKCASGTGEFFLQQLHRMDITLGDISNMEIPEKSFKVSGRCSVFCKSDCTHALNKGVPKDSVVAGLTAMMADKLDELLKKLPKDHVLLTGGCGDNQGMIHYLQEKIEDLFIPEEAPYFEALGAASWAINHETIPFTGFTELFHENVSHFSFHEPLTNFKHLVHFQSRLHSQAKVDDQTILGLDVGSTTTKGVIVRRSDKAILASSYLRTNGDPIRASRNVYEMLAQQIDVPISIEGMGVTGSGRQIAGLHAMASGVINEIIAHATAAAYFDPEVDTILEIGGQDAKYTYLTNGVPNDYAMNEACSAGTGSFLEESAKESLGIDVNEIGEVAYKGKKPPNFNDQCAAFISSDIKNAVQQNISTEDIVAGLVYSICMNFINRVKGNRPVGKKIFVQGGVCYNKAIPAAMAALTSRDIIVPPDPGLMGAFGVALEVEKRMEQGLLTGAHFDLEHLAAREVAYAKSFVCGGGKEKCDRKCEIAMIEIDGKRYPFGGICNRYDNIVHKTKSNVKNFDLVAARQKLIFRGQEEIVAGHPSVRMNRSFLVNTYFPFYKTFFNELGYNLLLPDSIDPVGVSQRGAPFCYPVEIAHGYMANMLTKNADFTFLPHLKGVPSGNNETSCTCVFVQSEPFYLQSAFSELDSATTLTPTIDFTNNYTQNQKTFAQIARQLGRSKKDGKNAFEKAFAAQNTLKKQMKKMGKQLLKELEKNPDETAIILFGRPYNSFAPEANKGITLKFSSRNVRIIPYDILPFIEELGEENNMYWAMGNMLMQCAHFVAKHPQLFATYITNFSCGPDSFVLTYFRDIMGEKPSLTLELDSHTADAGIETRIEAFLDIVASYRSLKMKKQKKRQESTFVPATIEYEDHTLYMRTSGGEQVALTDKRVRLLIPALGQFGTPLLAGSFSRAGIRADVLKPADESILKIGKSNSSCKECLPLQTTIGSVLHYLQHDRPEGELTVYLMPSAPGPCRFGQYNVFTKRVIEKHQIEDIAVFSPNSKNCYGDFSSNQAMAFWRAVMIGDLFDEMWATILTGAVDKDTALEILRKNHEYIRNTIDKDWKILAGQLDKSAQELSRIRLNKSYEEIPKISLVGEIYVRHDPLSLQHLVERMATRGFIIRTAQNSEWLKYLDWMIKNKILGKRSLSFWFGHLAKERADSKIRKLLAPSGLFYNGDMRVDHAISFGKKYISPQLAGEAILTVGTAFHEILNPSCGVISIGPFGCMPTRVAEAILNEKFTVGEKRSLLNGQTFLPLSSTHDDRKLPFLAIETDGNPFPQIIEARLEAFCLQCERLHEEMLKATLSH